jgi:hypothetical protein
VLSTGQHWDLGGFENLQAERIYGNRIYGKRYKSSQPGSTLNLELKIQEIFL